MKKFVITVCLAMGLGQSTLPMSAQQVTKEAALEKAVAFFQRSEGLSSNSRKAPRKASKLVLANSSDEFYIFNDEANGGYVVISGDVRMPDVLAYSYDGLIDTDNLPCNMRAWMDEYVGQVKYLKAHPEAKVKRRAKQERDNINPLLTSKFNQSYPYNNKCPVINGEHCVTGCAATAMAQIMHYYKWPKQTTDVLPGYKTFKNGFDIPAIPVTTIDWDNILDDYNSVDNYSEEQIDAISTLMLLCGVAINMDYGLSDSSADTYAALNALRDFFNYEDILEEVNRGNGANNLGDTSDGWGELIYDELNCGRPVLYSGSSAEWSGGHTFVVDGYENGFFHVNWGWGGYCTYVLMTDVEGWESFTSGHFAVVGIQPALPDSPRMYGVLDNGRITLFYDNKMTTRSGVVLKRDEWKKYKEDITECVIDPSFANLKIKMFTEFFHDWSNMKSIEGMEYLNTSMAWNMRYMFSGCSSLKNLDLSNFKTDKVREMIGMFTHCSSLTSLDVSSFQTDDVVYMEYMFYGCSGLTSLDLSSFKTSKVENMFSMFGECYNLGTIYVSDGWNTETVVNGDQIFLCCYNLVGGASTPFNWENTGLEYAHVDGGPSNPGYLTYKEYIAPDGINAPKIKQKEQDDGVYYTLQGICVTTPTKGVYIRKGKKFYIK